jgi:hypothetical protein
MDPWDPEECKSHQQHKWIHIPGASYGSSFESFCENFDPLLPLLLMRNHFDCSSKSKEKDTVAMQEGHRLTKRPMSLIAANSHAFWGVDNQLVAPIVIDTGASILVTGNKSDFVGEIHLVSPNQTLQGFEQQSHGPWSRNPPLDYSRPVPQSGNHSDLSLLRT